MPCNRFATSIEVWELQLLYTESAPRTTISAVQEEDDDAAGTEGGVYEALAAAAADIEASNDSGGAADVDIPKGVWLKKKAELLGWAKLRYFMLDVANAEFVYYGDSDGNGDGVERKGAIVLREVTAVDTDLEILIINTTDRNYELESKGAEEAATWAAHLKGVVDELHALDASIGSDAFSKDPVESVAGQPGAELEGRDAGSSASGSRSGSIDGRSGTTTAASSIPQSPFIRAVDVDGVASVVIVVQLPAQESTPISFDARAAGPRSVQWHWLEPATLVFYEALDGGDPSRKGEAEVPGGLRDAVFSLKGPAYNLAGNDKTELFTSDLRISSVGWSAAGAMFTVERWRKTRRMRLWITPPLLHGDSGGIAATAVKVPAFDRQYEDRYSSPGMYKTKRLQNGSRVVQTAPSGDVVLFGVGASPRGERPFVDVMSPEGPDFARRRLWRCPPAPLKDGDEPEDLGGEVGGVLVPDADRAEVFSQASFFYSSARLLVKTESQTVPPNYCIVKISDAPTTTSTTAAVSLARAASTAITAFPHPQPQLLHVKKEIIKYTRSDGIALDAQLFLPPGYNPATDGPRPCLMWAYPREFKSKKGAGQVRSSPYKFVRTGWSRPLPWLLRGYVVLEQFACPVVGEGEGVEPNDTFVEQLVSSAEAAVDAVVKRGVVDPDKIAVGGT